MTKVIEGILDARGLKTALVASRFNDFIVSRLISGAVDALVRHGASEEDITLVRVPGAFEIPQMVAAMARSAKYDMVIALGAVIRGSTPHFDYIASEVAKGGGTNGPCVDCRGKLRRAHDRQPGTGN